MQLMQVRTVLSLAFVLVIPVLGVSQVFSDVVTNSKGQPVAGASYRVCTDSACLNLATLYTDQTLTTPCNGSNGCQNPAVSDHLGRVIIFAESGIYYAKVSGYTILTYKYPIEIPGRGGASIAHTTNFIKGDNAGGGVDSGIYPSATSIDVRAYGMDCTGATDASSLWVANVTSGKSVFLPQGCTLKFSSNVTVPPTVTIQFVQGSSFSPDSGKTVTINGSIIAGARQKIVNGAGVVSFTAVPEVHIGWYGAIGDGVTDDCAPISATIASNPGRKIMLVKTQPSNSGGGTAGTTDYYSSCTFTMKGNGQWISGNVSAQWSGQTEIVFAPNISAIIVPSDCEGCKVTYLELDGPLSQCWNPRDILTFGNFGSAPGIQWYGGEPAIEYVETGCFNGDGVILEGSSPSWSPSPGGGQPDLGHIWELESVGNRGNGLLLQGADANIHSIISLDMRGNERFGVLDLSAFGAVYESPHSITNFNDSGYASGGNSRNIAAIIRTGNVVQACPFTNVSGFAVGQKIAIAEQTNDSTFNSKNSGLFTIASVSPGSDCVGPSNTVTAYVIASGGVQFTYSGSYQYLVGEPVKITGTGNGQLDTFTFYVSALGLDSTHFTANCTGCSDASASGLSGAGQVFFRSGVGFITWNQTAANSWGEGGYLGVGYDISSLSRTSNVVTLSTSATLVDDPALKAGGWVTISGTSIDGTYHITGGTNSSPWTFSLLGANFSPVAAGIMWSSSSTEVMLSSTRTVTDASISSGARSLVSRSAQFSTVNVGQPVSVAGAGSAGATLVTTISDFVNTNSVNLTTPASTTVTSAHADFGGGFDGGPYGSQTQATPAVWLNPYSETNQGAKGSKFNDSSVVIGGNNPGYIDYSFGIPQSVMGNGLFTSPHGGTFQSKADSNTIWTFQAGNTSYQTQHWQFWDKNSLQVEFARIGALARDSIEMPFLYYIGSASGEVDFYTPTASSTLNFQKGAPATTTNFWGKGNSACSAGGIMAQITTNGDWYYNNLCASSVALGNHDSPFQEFTAGFWSGTGDTLDYWKTQVVIGSGTSPTSTYKFIHSGTPGIAAVNVGQILQLEPIAFGSGLPAAANGSVLYCSDCNTDCTAGSSNGRICFRENGAWTH